jgi:diguanylate cyclase (GGDEF)-like protein/PAS domain S-box-containing protein
MRPRAGKRIRRAAAGISWRQGATVACALLVIIAMVVIAMSAQSDAKRHLDTELQMERVQTAGQQIAALTWEGQAEIRGPHHPSGDPGLIRRSFAVFTDLDRTLATLRRLDPSAVTTTLSRDVGLVYAESSAAVLIVGQGRSEGAMSMLQGALWPAVDALVHDAQHAVAAQKLVADRAARTASLAYIGSLLGGLLLLVILGVSLHRLRRAGMLSEAHRALERRSEERVRALIEHSSDVITVVDEELIIRWQSSSSRSTLGRAPDSLVGTRLSELVHPEDVLALEEQLAAGKERTGTFTARFRHADGEWLHLEAIAENRLADPAVEGVILSMRDVSERQALEAELRHQAFHDALTGLANRALFEDRLAHALAGARRHGRPVAVLFLDLDDFKTINDSLGHVSGDELLRAVAIRIAGMVRVTDTAARLGGDEFAILVEIMDDAADAELIAGRLLEVIAHPFEIAGRELRVSASIGLARSDGSTGVDELLRNADTAMYAAKESGKGLVQTFEPGMHERVLRRLELTGELQRALEENQFELDYQPIVELDTGAITGAEALVRWAHPTRGRLAPGHFIGLAEETGLIVPLGNWILNTACAQGARWQQEFPERALDINVNVSTRQLHDPDFPATVAAALEEAGLRPAQLVLEITESLLPDDSQQIIAQLTQLKAVGVRVAVDDFGTGYSALSRLQAYPVDFLKIDRSFIDGIENDPGKGQLVRGIVNLGESLHLQVVAEGIEEPDQADQLRRMRSPLGQGYLFSRPIDSERMAELLRDGRPLTATAAPVPH